MSQISAAILTRVNNVSHYRENMLLCFNTTESVGGNPGCMKSDEMDECCFPFLVVFKFGLAKLEAKTDSG